MKIKAGGNFDFKNFVINLRMMRLKSHLLFLFVIAAVHSAFSQDKLIKNDGTELQVKIIEINDTEVRYKMFNNPEGPLYIIHTSEFIRAEYENGKTKIFRNNTGNAPGKKRSGPGGKEEKVGDWIKFDIDAGAACGKSFTIIPRTLYAVDRYSNGNNYSRNAASNKTYFSPYVGLNFIFGRSNVLKHLLGVSYLNVKTNYHLSARSGFTPSYGASSPPYYAQSTNVSVSGSYHILALNSGLDFKVWKGLNLCMISSIGIVAKGTRVSNGYRVDYTTVADTVYPGVTTTGRRSLIENEKSANNSVTFFSLQAKVYYDFKINENVLGVYLLGNVSASNRLPYCSLGLSWYPFKKLRVTDL